MKEFLNEDFLLETGSAQHLYHEYAEGMPIFDYHCHLSPIDIANDRQFENIAQAWLEGDHYKWRAMRTNGVNESYCTGNKSSWEKFEQWARTAPSTFRNPLYHWTHLELRRYFNVKEQLQGSTAKKIYDHCNALLASKEYSVKNLLRKMNVRVVGTTDDPADSLGSHRRIKEEGFEISILPTFRPDAAMDTHDPARFNGYIDRLGNVANVSITTYEDLINALKSRHDHFGLNGCRLSDHGLEEIYADDYTEKEVTSFFLKIRRGKALEENEQRKFKSALLLQLAEWDWEKGWVQQFHLGAMRNNNSRMMQLLGRDTGWDSIGDWRQAQSLSRFLDRLDSKNKLAKTILYNLNPSDNAVMATMAGNFNDGSVAGKIQWGSAWWFLDQKEGMTTQLSTLSSMGLISRFIGMITDSRSFLSYPRHEYFRRILCNLLGNEVEKGEWPNDLSWIGGIIQDICYNNAATYLNYPTAKQ